MHAHVYPRLRTMATTGMVVTWLLTGFVPAVAGAIELPEIPETRTAAEVSADAHDRHGAAGIELQDIGPSPAASLLTEDLNELTETGAGELELDTSEPVQEAPPAKTPEQIAIDTAMAQLGKPYRWGGSGPGSFDCSGLTAYAWAAAGVSLPHNSGAQYAATQRVPLDAMEPGDLIFAGNGRISHVGLYLGDGQMVHAPRSGRTVEVAPLHSNLIGAGRPHP